MPLGPILAWVLGNLPMIVKVIRELYEADTCEDGAQRSELKERLLARIHRQVPTVSDGGGRDSGNASGLRNADDLHQERGAGAPAADDSESQSVGDGQERERDAGNS